MPNQQNQDDTITSSKFVMNKRDFEHIKDFLSAQQSQAMAEHALGSINPAFQNSIKENSFVQINSMQTNLVPHAK
jgi:hypothetical protein